MRNNNRDSIFIKTSIRYYFELLFSFFVTLILSYYLWKKAFIPLYSSLIPNPVLVFVFIFIIVVCYTSLIGVIEKLLVRIYNIDNPIETKRIVVSVLFCGLVIALVASVLEIIYELGVKKQHINKVDQIVYCVDDSGSMTENDNDFTRLSAVEKILKKNQKVKKAGLVRFNDKVTYQLSLRNPKDNAFHLNLIKKEAGGGTNIGEALNTSLNMLKKSDKNQNNSILLFTDGIMTEPFNENDFIDNCKRDKVIVNAVSLGHDTDMGFLERITKKTGGEVALSPDSEYIEAAYSILSGKHINRCLFIPILIASQKSASAKLMQIVFLSIIGVLIHLNIIKMLRHKSFVNKQIKIAPILVIIGSLLMMINNAGTISTFILLVVYLIPLYTGKVYFCNYSKLWNYRKIKRSSFKAQKGKCSSLKVNTINSRIQKL